ncbi:MAG TPA: nuclear transport factor 2 family protein [Candidatus Dormibacteraeota bacterium]|nr:nuclear transport factor 2 family protein [Candidatus Dormibacteraeota bacterium]
MNETSIPDAFLAALTARDFGRLAECLAPSAQARLLLPHGPEVQSGRDDIVRRIQGWFASGSDYSVLDSSHDPVGLRHRVSWRLRMSRNGQPPEIVEQVAFIDVGPDGITRIDLLCSGFMPDESVASCAA